MSTLRIVFEIGLWLCLGTVAYVYVGYPLTLLVLRRRPRRVLRHGTLPTVTVVVAAYNEAKHIEDTVRNKLAQDYPADLLDLIVVSDGSTDRTAEIVASIDDRRLILFSQDHRQGKTLALNRGVEAARGEIVVFSDANSRFDDLAIRRLVECFADPDVGYVTGRLVYEDPGETAVGGGSGLYMRYENWLRHLETLVGSVVGVNGGIDAVRRILYQPMRADQLPDFILPLRVVQQGSRVIFCESAIAYEHALGWQADEFRMRVRVSLRALHGLSDMRTLLRPRHGLFAFQLFAHKLLRYLLILPLAGALILNAMLLGSPLYDAMFAAQVLCYALAFGGWLSGGRIRFPPVFVPFYFCLINLAAGAAFLGFLRGDRQVLWTPRKGA